MRRILSIIITAALLTSCEKMAIYSTPQKKVIPSHTQFAQHAENEFWTTLHKGEYKNIHHTTELLTAAYLENPNDPSLAAHLGFLHIWKITERARENDVPATITNEIILAKRYFADAAAMSPEDARFQGFLGASMLVEGSILRDQREEVRGYFQLKHAINLWPEFNYFTAGYVMSDLDPTSSQFKEALEWQWKTLDLCAGKKVDRNNPDFRPYLSLETQTGPKRACWNSWIAPHNFEGFFMNMGDMLVKAGDSRTAVKIYENAKLSKTYAEWPYRNKLEERISSAKGSQTSTPHRMMFNSGYGCVACHQGK